MPVPRALERLGGLQTQYAPSGYIGLWSRLAGFARSDLTTALERRRAVQGTLMRSTIHMVSATDYPLFASGIRRARREWWMRITRSRDLDGHEYEDVAAVIRRELSAGPRKRAELVDAIVAAGFPKAVWEGASSWIDLVRVPPLGTWDRRRADLYGLAETWLPPSQASEAEGLKHLLTRYLRGFGPASLGDASDWAGVPLTTLRDVAERMQLRRFRDEAGAELIDVPKGLLPDPDTPAPVRFLPTWDATLLIHARRTQILPEQYRSAIFHTKNPHSIGTFLVDGSVAGTWRFDGVRIVTESFERLRPATRREVAEESARLAAFHAD